MKKSKLLLFALFPAMALSSCGIADYATNYKTINKAFEDVQKLNEKASNSIGFKKTFTSEATAEMFSTYPNLTTDKDGNEVTKSAKSTLKYAFKVKDAIFETDSNALHGKIKIEFNEFIKDTGDHDTSTEVSVMKANTLADETPKDPSTDPTKPEDSSTTPDVKPDTNPDGETTTPDTTPDGETTPDTTPDGETTTPDTTPDGETTTPDTTPDAGETVPEEEAKPDYKKGVKNKGALNIETYLFKLDKSIIFTLEGDLAVAGVKTYNQTFKYYSELDDVYYNEVIKNHKDESNRFAGQLPEPEKKADDSTKAKATEITPTSAKEKVLRYVNTYNKNEGEEIGIKYELALKDKPLVPGTANDVTVGLDAKYKTGLIDSVTTKANVVNILNRAENEYKMNMHFASKTTSKYEAIETLTIPETLEGYEKTENLSSYDLENIYSIFLNGFQELALNAGKITE